MVWCGVGSGGDDDGALRKAYASGSDYYLPLVCSQIGL